METPKYPISVLIPTLNEADNLRELLPLVQWAAEIVVVDSFSTDDTIAVAQQYNARVLQNQYITPAQQKNWAIPQMQYEWVFIIDADERPTPALNAEIQAWLQRAAQSDIVGFWIGRQNHFLGQPVRYSGWQGDKVVRLVRRDVCRYDNKRVHEEIDTKNLNISRLEHKLLHYTYQNLDHFIDKLQRYATWAAQDYAHKTPRVGLFHLWGKPFFRFVKHFCLQKGFLDGRIGFIVSVLMAWGVFLRYAKLMELQQKGDLPPSV